jgi:hypothetical protein
MPRTHYLSDEQVDYKWDTGNEPLELRLAPSGSVTLDGVRSARSRRT